MMEVLDGIWAFLEVLGGSLHITDAKADPETLRRRWPTVVIIWLLAAAGVVYGVSIVREASTTQGFQTGGWLWIAGSSSVAALLTHRWRSLAWPSVRQGDR